MMTTARQGLVERLDERADEIVEFATELIAIPTENPPGNAYSQCLALLQNQLARLDLPFERIALGPDRTALISGLGRGPTLYLHGHYDVVPALDRSQFEPVVKDGRLFGRGATDMKAAIVAMMFSLDALRSEALPGRVEFVMVPDEESGGERGSKVLLETGRLGRNGVGAIIGEPTSGTIWYANRGALTVRVNVAGTQAHVGLHFRGVNAFENAIPILLALESLKTHVAVHETAFEIQPAEAKRSVLMLGGEVSGGNQFNTVPDGFSFTIDRRFNPEEGLATVKRQLLDTIAGAKGEANVEIEILQEGGSSATDADSTFCQAIRESIRDTTGKDPRFEMCPGLLESRFYAAAGVPAVAYGPGELELAHGPKESVAIHRILECAQTYCLTAVRILGTAGEVQTVIDS